MQAAVDITSRVYWNPDPDRRASQRTQVRLTGQVENAGHNTAYVVIGDISTDGFSFRSFELFAPGARIGLELVGVGLKTAQVIWADGVRTGCRFDEPLTSAELASVIGASAL